jgi:hypothetical protein
VNQAARLLSLVCTLASLGACASGPTGPTDPTVQATLGISVPARAPGKIRSVPTELAPAQCEHLGRIDGAVDREAGVTPSTVAGGDFTLLQEPGKERQIRVSLGRGGRNFTCAAAYTREYEAAYAPP